MAELNITTLGSARKQRAPRVDSNGRAISSERYGKTYYRNRNRVLREEDHCHICGGLVDKTISGRDPQGPSIDHIIPVAAGGGHDRGNLRLAHQHCNNTRQTDGMITRPPRQRPAQQHPGLR